MISKQPVLFESSHSPPLTTPLHRRSSAKVSPFSTYVHRMPPTTVNYEVSNKPFTAPIDCKLYREVGGEVPGLGCSN